MLDWLNDSPGFPERKNADSQNREAENTHGYAVSPVSRFSRFQNEGAAQQQDEDAGGTEKNIPHISNLVPDVLDAIAASLEPAPPEESSSPTPEEIAELDALMVRLCELEPWLADSLPEMQAVRRSMAPANVAKCLDCFRQFVREAEARRGAVLGAGDGKLSALEKTSDARENARQEREQATGPPPLASGLRHRHQTATKGTPI